ncbi:MAG: DUF2635 domain-containing protein [Burkholderiales bacterium]|nr:DUF2635 domain-containing protein [Burkholderiales bacterium]
MSNPQKLFVKPAAGRRVLDPATRKALPAEGAEVERNTYWLRRLREGDVAEGRAAASKPKSKE